MKTKHSIYFILIIGFIYACSSTSVKPESETRGILEGTWKLTEIKTIENGDTMVEPFSSELKGIKMLNNSHFAFFQHDLHKGTDSSNTVFVSGGGAYILNGNKYTEHLEYCNIRIYEGNTFTFEVEVNGDTLVQQGVEELPEAGVNKYIIETYVRIVANEARNPRK